MADEQFVDAVAEAPPPYESVDPRELEEVVVQQETYAPVSAGYTDEPMKADLSISGVDVWSVLKVGFLISIAIGIATVAAAVLLWFVLDGMGVFSAVEDFLIELNAESFLGLMEYLRLSRVVSYATILGVVNVVLTTAISALAALLYNLIAALVGGVRVSLMDE